MPAAPGRVLCSWRPRRHLWGRTGATGRRRTRVRSSFDYAVWRTHFACRVPTPRDAGFAAQRGYYVSGTRVSLDSIVYADRRGESAESIRQNYPSLSLVQVSGAITFYESNQPIVDAYLAEAEKEWDEFARDHPLPEELLQKLERARQEVFARRP